MSQSLEFSAQQGLTLTAIARAIGAFSGGTAADSVTNQAGTDRYLAVFNTNLAAGTYRLDYFRSGVAFGSEIFEVSGNGTFQPRSEQKPSASVNVLPMQASRTLKTVGNDIHIRVRERCLVGFNVVDANDNPVDLDAMNLVVIIESLDGLTEHTVANGDITRADDSFTFRIPSAVTASPREWLWSLREVGFDDHLIGGKVYVTYAP